MLSSTRIGGVSAAPTQGQVISIQYEGGKKACFPAFFLVASEFCHSCHVAFQPHNPDLEPTDYGLKHSQANSFVLNFRCQIVCVSKKRKVTKTINEIVLHGMIFTIFYLNLVILISKLRKLF